MERDAEGLRRRVAGTSVPADDEDSPTQAREGVSRAVDTAESEPIGPPPTGGDEG